MCKMAGIIKGDRVIDLGCGDASILIVAAREYGAISYGVELNPVVAMMARARIRLAGVQDKVKIVRGNMYKVDLPDADIAMMYMLPKATLKIEGILRDRYDHLKVVSHGFELKGKTLEKVKVGGAVLRRYEW
jgi:predicted RNA methylase